MKPHTPYQHQVAKANAAIKPITERAKQYGIKHACEHYAWKNKTATICMECGQILTKETHCCPHCGAKLKTITTRKRVQTERWYFTTIERINGLQVFRYFVIHQDMLKGQKARYYFLEAFRLFFNEKGQIEVCARLRANSYYYNDVWSYTSELILRQRNKAWSLTPYQTTSNAYFNENGMIPTFHRLHLSADDFMQQNPITLIPKLLAHPHCETLWKMKQKDLVVHLSTYEIDQYWDSLKIALRHHYTIPDARNYMDYLIQLGKLRKDLHSPHYLCPVNFEQAHAATTAKCVSLTDKDKWKSEQPAYAKQKGKFFGVVIGNEHINISVLKSIYDFYAEGNAMHHCVYTNRYYSHANSLILSARNAKDERLATIEIDLRTMQIMQIRAKFNAVPKEYEEIKALLQKNMHIIRDIQYPPKKKRQRKAA